MTKKHTHRLNLTKENTPKEPFPKIVRITVTDKDATDCSSDEGEQRFKPNRLKKFVNEIIIEPCVPENNNNRGSGGGGGVSRKRNRTNGGGGKARAPVSRQVYSGKKYRGDSSSPANDAFNSFNSFNTLPENIFYADVDCSEYFDFGLESLHTHKDEDFFQDIDDLFASDALLAL
ncbi:hypothetical protein TSUD_227140 [Trifolium subterraneum]|uniref:Uncharacterized protein n=1 Tax=Trifolium subterraneum TaxID=3900 RepID=A0A2Z6NCS5_TRISU|nr:hypothetical protein TSUD_227140 [Trifolium subterraneum]